MPTARSSMPFAHLAALLPLGRFEVPAFPWPWWCWAVGVDGSITHQPGTVFPGLLLLPAYGWGFDADLLLAWAAGEDVGPEDKLLARLLQPRVPGWERVPRAFSIPAALENFSRQVEVAVETAKTGPTGMRRVAMSRPWAFTTAPILELAHGQLGCPADGDWLDRSLAALQAAQAVPASRGRPPGNDMDRALALRDEVGWLRSRVGRGRALAQELEVLIHVHGDRETWPTRGLDESTGDRRRFRDALHKVRARVRSSGGVPVLVPHVEAARPRTGQTGWLPGVEGGPENERLIRWAGGRWFADLLRIVAGGSFQTLSSMGLVTPGEFEWADLVSPTPRVPADNPLPGRCPRHGERPATRSGFGSAWCEECWATLAAQATDQRLPGWDGHGQDIAVVGDRCVLHAERQSVGIAFGQHWCADCMEAHVQPVLSDPGSGTKT